MAYCYFEKALNIYGVKENKFLPNSLKTLFSRTKLALGSLLLLALTVAIGGLIFFGWLTEQMSEGDTRFFDDAVRLFVNQYSSPVLTNVMQIASFLGSTVFLTILVSAFLLHSDCSNGDVRRCFWQSRWLAPRFFCSR
jgi:hypothetical protein